MRSLFLYVAALALLGAAAANAEDRIECSGLFGRDTSHAALVKAYGEANVVYKKIDAPQGSTGMATVVFERIRDRRLTIEWFDEKALSRPIYIGIEGPKWVAPLGIRLGTPIEEVEKLNGKTFRLNGFGWDGKLGNVQGGCHFGIKFEPTAEGLPLGGKYRVLNGNKDLYSNLPLLREVKPAVVEILIIYSENH
jgi:hypothetical protein